MKTTQSRKVLLFLFITLFVVFSYTFLHEGGHAVAGILSGGRLTAFSLNFFDLSAHVSLDGNFNLPQILLINLAGVSLPLLVWLILMLAVPRQANLAIESLKVVATLITLNTLLAWIVLPLLFLAGKAPAEYVTSFLRNSDLNPWLVSLLALLIYIAGWLLFTQKIVGVRSELAFFQKTDQESVTPAVWKSILSMLALLVLFGLTGFAANGFRLTTQKIGSYLPPAGYSLVNTVDLSEKAYEQDILYTFSIDQPMVAGVYLLVQNINTQYIEVTLVGPNNYSHVILHGEGYTAAQDSPHIEELLHPGHYQVTLTSQQSPGSIAVYVLH